MTAVAEHHDAAAGDVTELVRRLVAESTGRRPRQIGYPVATDVDFRAVMPLFNVFLNNIGDPSLPGLFNNTMAVERAVIDWHAALLGLPAHDRWGYITAGGTEGNLAGIHAGRSRLPGAVIYHSSAAHYSIAKLSDVLDAAGGHSVVVDQDARGEMDYQHLATLVAQHAAHPAVVVATAGTTMTEAVDSTARIARILDRHRVPGRHVHVDAALSGIPLALDGRLRFGTDVDSVSISGHKWLGAPIPCGLVLMRDSARRRGRHIAYTGTLDTTMSGSRCGQAAVLLWHAIQDVAARPGGHQGRVQDARALAAYAVAELTAIGWPAWRHEHGVTVVLATPPAEVVHDRGWILATEGERAHIICMPGVTSDVIDAFVCDLAEVTRTRADPRRRHSAAAV